MAPQCWDYDVCYHHNINNTILYCSICYSLLTCVFYWDVTTVSLVKVRTYKLIWACYAYLTGVIHCLQSLSSFKSAYDLFGPLSFIADIKT